MKGLKKLLLLVVFVALLTTGCSMKEHIGLKIDANKEITLEMIMAMDNEMIDSMINMGNMNMDEDEETEGDEEALEETEEAELNITDEMRWEYLKEAFNLSELQAENPNAKVEQYNKDGYKGYTISENVGNIDKFVTTDANAEKVNIEEAEDGKMFIKNGEVYKSNLTFTNEQLSGASSYEQMGAAFDIKFILTLPNKSISNNATTVSSDGKTLTWDLMKTSNIDFEFKFGGDSNYLPYIIAGVLLAVIIIVLIVVLASKKKKTPSAPVNNGPVQDLNKFEEQNQQQTMNNQFNNVNQQTNNVQEDMNNIQNNQQ